MKCKVFENNDPLETQRQKKTPQPCSSPTELEDKHLGLNVFNTYQMKNISVYSLSLDYLFE